MMQFQYLLHNIPRVENMLNGKAANEGMDAGSSGPPISSMSSEKISAVMRSKGIQVPE